MVKAYIASLSVFYIPIFNKTVIMIKHLYTTKIKPALVKAVNEIRHPASNPRLTALSMSLGVFVAILVPLGLQSFAFVGLMAIVRYNIIIACTISFITNPLTFLPLYYIAIKIGEFLIGDTFPWKYFNAFIDKPDWSYLLKFGWKGTVILFAGLILLTVIFTPLTYVLSFKLTALIRKEKS